MQKYTTKALLQLEFDHSPSKCKIQNCPKCAAYYAYQDGLRLQGQVMELVYQGWVLADIAETLAISKDRVQDIVVAATDGSTFSAVQHGAYQAQLAILVANGLSIPAIAKRLNQSIAAIKSYLKDNCMDKPQIQQLRISKVKYIGGYRYFDKRGIEYSVSVKRNWRSTKC